MIRHVQHVGIPAIIAARCVQIAHETVALHQLDNGSTSAAVTHSLTWCRIKVGPIDAAASGPFPKIGPFKTDT